MFVLNKRVAAKMSRPRRRILKLAMGLALLAAVALTAHYLGAPSHGQEVTHIDVKTTKGVTHSADSPSTPASDLQNSYFTLSLPAGYQLQPGAGTPAGLLYQQNLIKTSADSSLLLAIAVGAMPSGGLDNDSSYTSRSQQPAKYRLTDQIIGGDTVRIAASLQDDGVVAFWPHGANLATISVTTGLADTGPGDVTDEMTALSGLLSAWQWR